MSKVRVCSNKIDFSTLGSDDCKAIAQLSSYRAIGVLNNKNSNQRLLTKFISEGFFAPGEVDELHESSSLTVWSWGQKLWNLISNCPRIGEILHFLKNLNDTDLKNYQTEFRKILAVNADKHFNRCEQTSPQVTCNERFQRETRNEVGDEGDSKLSLVRSKIKTSTNSPVGLRDKIWNMGKSRGIQYGACIIILLLFAGGLGFVIANEDFLNHDSNSTVENSTIESIPASPLVKQEELEKSDEGNDSGNSGSPISTPQPAHSFTQVEPSTFNYPQPPTALPGIINIFAPNTRQNKTRDIKDFFVNQIYVKRPSDIVDNLENICSLQYNTSLVINAIDTYDWYKFNIDCGPRVRYLTLKGHLSVTQIHQILNQTSRIVDLKLEGGDLCMESAELTKAEIEALPVISLIRLRTLTLSGFVETDTNCKGLLTLFASKIVNRKVKVMNFDKMAWTKKNKPELQRIIYNVRSSLQELHLNEIDLQTSIFDLNFPPLNLSVFSFNVSNTRAEVAYESLEYFLVKVNSAEEFRSNVEISERNIQSTLKNLNRLNVKHLGLTIRLDNDRTELSLKFIKHFRKLRSCHLHLVVSPNRTSNSRILLKDFSYIRRWLTHFHISTNFPFRDVGASDMHCRWYDSGVDGWSTNFLVLNRCDDCGREGCKRR